MGMPEALREWTAERVRTLPDDGMRYEVVDGELLVTPSPATPHQRALGELHLRLGGYLRGGTVGELFLSPADVEFDPRTLVQPDLFVVPLREGRRLRRWADIDQLILAIEILSPSTARYDRLTKRRLYQRQRIEYWIVDLDARVIERWRADDERPEIVADRLRWHPSGASEPFTLEVEEYFAQVMD